MVEPAAQRAIEPEFRKTLGDCPADRRHRIRVVFLDRQIEHGDALVALTFIRIKIAHEKVRADTGLFCVGIAPVAGDDKIRVPDAGQIVRLPAGDDRAKLLHSASQRNRDCPESSPKVGLF